MGAQRRRTIAAAAAAAALLGVAPVQSASVAAGPAPALPQPVTEAPVGRDANLAPGVVYRALKINGPNRIKMVIVDPSSQAMIDVALARNSFPGYAKTSTMGQAHDALAAVNGDFGLSPGRPGHAYAEDGQFIQTSPLGSDGKNFAVSADERNAFIGRPDISLTVTRVATGASFSIDHWNEGEARAGHIAAFTPAGGSVERPDGGCAARLLPVNAPSWAPNQAGVQRTYTVDAVGCGGDPLTRGDHGIVIEADSGTSGATNVRSLARGESVTVTWSMGWRGVLESIGGSPVLIENGRIVVDNCNAYLCRRHPRTAVGITGAGKIMLFVVDGRSSVSIGMTLVGLAREMKNRGAVWALNLDGGGSTTMWVRGRGVVNRPSDGSERTVTSALMVLPRPDAGDPANLLPGSAARSTEAPTAEQLADFETAAADPGSTGGLTDYLDRTDGATGT